MGRAKKVGPDGATTVSVAIDKASGLLTLGGTAGGGVPTTFGASDLSPGDFWDWGKYLVLDGVAYHLGEWQSTTTRKVSRVGAVASMIVTPDDTALDDEAASSAFECWEYVHRQAVRGTARTGADTSFSSAGKTRSLSLQLAAFEVEDYTLKDIGA